MDEQEKVALEADDQVLAAPADGGDLFTGQRIERGIEGLERVQAGRCGRLDLGAGDGSTDPARGDLDLWQLRHPKESFTYLLGNAHGSLRPR